MGKLGLAFASLTWMGRLVLMLRMLEPGQRVLQVQEEQLREQVVYPKLQHGLWWVVVGIAQHENWKQEKFGAGLTAELGQPELELELLLCKGNKLGLQRTIVSKLVQRQVAMDQVPAVL